MSKPAIAAAVAAGKAKQLAKAELSAAGLLEEVRSLATVRSSPSVLGVFGNVVLLDVREPWELRERPLAV